MRQGHSLSSKLFILELRFRRLDWDNYGIIINGRRLNHLRFADDIVLLEGDPKKLEHMIKYIAEKSRKMSLETNNDKTKLMTNSIKNNIEVYGTKLEYVHEYVYLEQIISLMSKETNKRIASGWKKYWSLKEIMKM